MLPLRVRLAIVVCLGSAWLVTAPLLAQWPTVLMFYGGPLKAPIVLSGADSVAVGDAFRPPRFDEARNASAMGNRPFVNVACFWGPPQNPAINGVAMADLKPEMASQHARFYPATKTQPPAVFLTSLSNISMKGRDVYGFLATVGSTNPQGNGAKIVRGGGPPGSAALFWAAPSTPPQTAIERMKALGIPTAVDVPASSR